ncbi:receptor-binding cancer antigen expressed on SiSo cells isoform X3 [Melanerpes formicivorus]|uniref:receptor-binding cancer antigen expressed on SiSo cells isoform X3 n=1 Tax=Melanerpes formicivorus TaxID=211600 RepID=UPI00358FE4A5
MAITQFRLFKICTCLAAVLSFIKKLICRSGRGRKLSGDQITLPTTVDYSSVPKQPEVEDWSSWDEDAPTSVKIEGGNGSVAAQQNPLEQMEPDYFKDMTPTIRKTQKIVIKKREPLNFGIPEGNAGFSSRLAATQDIPFIHQSTTEDGRKGKKSSRTATKENGERGPKANEKGTKQNWCKTVLTETRHQWQ